jgi:type I restriction-modification system DNA methylase subunit
MEKRGNRLLLIPMAPFEEVLGDYLRRREALGAQGASEDSLRDAFLEFLRQAFPRLTRAESLELEKYIPGLRVRGGFADILYEDLIFEFKRRLEPDSLIKEAERQLERYLRNQPAPERFFGMLTDGVKIWVYALRDGNLERIDQITLDGSSPEKARFCKIWLDSYLFHERLVPPTTEDIVRRFGEHSPTFHQGMRVLKSLWTEVRSSPAAQTKFAEWQNLLSLVYGSEVGEENLFLRHTYLALFARVLAFVVLFQKAPQETDIEPLLSGKAFQQKGLKNFGQADFFIWMGAQNPLFAEFLHSLGLRLTTTYDLSHITEDLLKGLYQELVDPETRHDLGEFYTPDWLAELTLRQAGFLETENPSLLDPACGSGTFLFTAIRLQSQKLQGATLVEWASSHLAGLEVHPLAVFIAQTNFLLALRPHLKHYKKSLPLPIYMADALSLPHEKTSSLLVPVPVETLAKTTSKNPHNLPTAFEIPVALAQNPQQFDEALSALVELAQPHHSIEAARTGLENRLRRLDLAPDQISTWHRNLRLMRWLLQEPPTDTVWEFILRNAYQPALLAHRQFSFVVGNPPWLAYRYVKRPDYQERLRTLLTQTYHLLPSHDTHLFTQMELATLFFAVCEKHYLREGGTLAFVMPRSILTGAKQHTAFQKHYLSKAHLLIDCEKVTPLFHVPTCVVIYHKNPSTPAPSIPLLHLSGELPHHNSSWSEAQKHLHIEESSFSLPQPLGESPYLASLRAGASIYPRVFWFVRPQEGVEILDIERPQIETDPRIQLQAKAPWKGLSLQGAVEAEYLFATLLSDDMLPFGWRQLSLTVLPLEKLQRRLINPEQAITKGHTGLADWLQKADALWQKHRKSQEDLLPYLNWQNKLTLQTPVGPYKLLYNASGTYLCACVVETPAVTQTPVYGLPVQGFIADIKTYWLETDEPEEAYYLAAILNSPLVDKLIKPFQTKGNFGATSGRGERDICRRPFEVVPIPRYKVLEVVHKELAELGRRCHERVGAFLRETDEEALQGRIGPLRQKVRDYLQKELKEIDALVQRLIPELSEREEARR